MTFVLRNEGIHSEDLAGWPIGTNLDGGSPSKFRLMLKRIFNTLRIMGVAFMIAIANVYKGEQRTIDDTTDKIEHVETMENDEPFSYLDE